ncbi:hypothetical protein AB6A40_003012 [Gnathostoma spinigerum]|uniref:FAD dependent oxidoreductase domain-containing protein n=1 Tax=Gnathostoma spinigerum TaxID=75299 RepID=A0ABD6EH71_9BILA
MASLKRLQFRFLQCRNCFHHQLHFASNVSSKKLCSADVVICGGGLSGCSVAYHLAKLGKNVVVFERDFVGCAGATSVCSGLMTSPINWQNSTNQYMNKLSMDLYTDLASTSKFRFERCGRLYLAHSLTSEIGLRRIYSDSKLLTEEAELIDDAGDLFERWPVLLTEDVQLALLSMSDISLDPIGLTQALMHRAKEYSAKFYEQTAVNEVVLGDDGEVVAVHTDKGIVETSRFVDAAGIVYVLFR